MTMTTEIRLQDEWNRLVNLREQIDDEASAAYAAAAAAADTAYAALLAYREGQRRPTNEEIRAEIARLVAAAVAAAPGDDDTEMPADIRRPIDDLANVLVARGAACWWCLFGRDGLSSRCQHA